MFDFLLVWQLSMLSDILLQQLVVLRPFLLVLCHKMVVSFSF